MSFRRPGIESSEVERSLGEVVDRSQRVARPAQVVRDLVEQLVGRRQVASRLEHEEPVVVRTKHVQFAIGADVVDPGVRAGVRHEQQAFIEAYRQAVGHQLLRHRVGIKLALRARGAGWSSYALPMSDGDAQDDRVEREGWVRQVIEQLHDEYGRLSEGEPADYIPELANVDPDDFAISVATTDGRQVGVGDVGQPFTIQSISKLMMYGLALETHGRDQVMRRVGVAPTGDRFNAIVLDESDNRAPNPMVNAGAIAVTDLVVGDDIGERVEVVRSLYERYLGRRPELDRDVWASERATGNRNRAIAYLMLSRGIIDERVEETLDLYFAQCSVLVTCDDVALIGATLANHGVHPTTGEQVVAPDVVRDMMSVALTCGMYDYAGEWVFTVGIPAKSGVGGGILGVLPGIGGLATFSPRLDEYGNSVRGVKVFEELSARFSLHLFDRERPWQRQAAPSTG